MKWVEEAEHRVSRANGNRQTLDAWARRASDQKEKRGRDHSSPGQDRRVGNPIR